MIATEYLDSLLEQRNQRGDLIKLKDDWLIKGKISGIQKYVKYISTELVYS